MPNCASSVPSGKGASRRLPLTKCFACTGSFWARPGNVLWEGSKLLTFFANPNIDPSGFLRIHVKIGTMKICVYGAGAVGGLIAAWLSRSGHDVSVVARGAHLDAIRREGLKVRDR